MGEAIFDFRHMLCHEGLSINPEVYSGIGIGFGLAHGL
jgi:hypothetical protein